MEVRTVRSIDGRLYRAALLLCPGGFRRDYGEEMARDFDEARGEAVVEGRRAVWTLRLLLGLDLARTLVVQWLRTGFPAIACAAMFLSLLLTAGLASVARRATVQIPPDVVHSELLGILLLVVIAVMLIAMTIVLNLWVHRPGRFGRR
jgi:hypothetical protein